MKISLVLLFLLSKIYFKMKLNKLLYLLLVSVFVSCGTSSVIVNLQRPADISVPQSVQKVVVVNRSVAGKGNMVGNIVEGIFSGEGIGADKKGSEYCVMGLSQMLANSERYDLRGGGDLTLKGTGTSTFPELLDWKEVQSICDTYGADALIVLSTFDSDSRTFEGKKVVKTKTVKGAKIKEVRYPVTLVMEIESGWRIYDATTKNIVDVNKFTEVKEYVEWGSSYDDARVHLPSKRQALKSSGIFAGEQYGFRITPVWVRQSRLYFTGKSDELKLAKNYVKRGDWDKSIEIWKSATNHEDYKVARKAYFNLALASEIKGKLDTAIDYAEKAEQMGEKRATSYISTLKKRKRDEKRLQEQLNN